MSSGSRKAPSDLDVHRSAGVLIREHGNDAPIRAAMMADKMLDKGDLDGRATWLRILGAVEELQRDEKQKGADVH